MDVTLAVDALGPQLTGIGRYVWELCERLPRQADIDRVGFFVNGHFIDRPQSLLNDDSIRRRSRLPRSLRRRLVRRRLHRTLVHGPNYFLPPEVESGVITVHDLSVFRHPETHPTDRVRQFERDFERSLRRASHVITDTETVRQEVITEFGFPEKRVTAIPLGVDVRYRPRLPEDLRPDLTPLGLRPGEYGLCVSTLEPRKKIAELLRAWRHLPEQLRASTPLVLAGAKGWLNDWLHDEIVDASAAGWLKHLGYVSERHLPALYAGARLFVYPSVYEGFGLPPVEAMASGVPVMVSKKSCLPEVCGEAAVYVDPEDSTGFASAIEQCLTDGKWRGEAVARGLARAAGFTWERCVSETVELYSQACARGA